MLAFAATGEGPFGTGATAALLYRVVHGSPGPDRVPSEVRPLIERCLAKDPGQRPTADGLLAEVGALQPTANWLPESIIRAFAQDATSGPGRPPHAATPASALGGLAALGFGEASTQTTAASAAAQVPSEESLLLAPAGNPQTGTSKSMPPPGDTYPPRDAYPQPRLARGTGRGAACCGHWCWRGSSAALSWHPQPVSRDRSHRAHVYPDSLPRRGLTSTRGGIHARRARPHPRRRAPPRPHRHPLLRSSAADEASLIWSHRV